MSTKTITGIPASGGSISDTAYGAGWNGVTDEGASKNALYDKIEAIILAGGGDMLKSTYDPTTVNGDAFDMANMAEGATEKILTATERTKLGNIEDNADVTDADNISSSIVGVAAKTTPVDADTLPLIDSADSNNLKELSITNFLANKIKGYIEGLTSYFNVSSDTLDDITDGTTYVRSHNDYDDTAVSKLSGIEEAADVTDATNVDGAGAVMESDYNATTFLYATSDNTPQPKTPSEVLGVLSGNASAAFSMNTQKITNVTDPTADQDAATKKYVDDNAGGGATLWTSWNASRNADGVIDSDAAGDDLPVGTAIRYRATDGTWRYGKVKSVATRAHSILGYPCTTSDDDEFQYDSSGLKSDTLTVHLADNFNDADDDALLLNDLNMKLGLRPALSGEFYCVGITTVCDSADTSSDPDINVVEFGGTNKLFTSDVTVNETRSDSGATVEVTNNYYAMDLDSAIDLSVDKVGAGDAYDGDVELHFVRA